MKWTACLLAALTITACQNDKQTDNQNWGLSNCPQPLKATINHFETSITDFGAMGDGKTLNTEAFAKAIDHAYQQGGGKVIVPAGIWLTGPIELRSGIELHLEQNALITFSGDFNLYPIRETSFEGLNTRRCTSPIWAKDAENIAITGMGVIDGNGQAWRPVKRSKMTESQWKQLLKEGGVVKDDIWYPSEASLKGAEKCLMFNNPMGLTTDQEWTEVQQWLRPVLLSLISCNKVLIEGVTFRNSPAWCLHPLMCENVILDGVKVFNPWYSQNGDALDLESCNKVLIQNCLFDAGDDAICIKSGKDRDGRERGIPCQNVYIRDNVVLHGHGGFVVGSEMSGGVRNLLIENCTFLGTDVGLRFKSTRGRGGVVEDIHIKGINMIDIAHEAIIMDLYYAGKASGEGDENNPTENTIPEVTEETPAFRNITMDNIVCNGAKIAVKINGLPEMPVENVTISNAIFNNCKQEAEIKRGKNIVMKNVLINEKIFSYNH